MPTRRRVHQRAAVRAVALPIALVVFVGVAAVVAPVATPPPAAAQTSTCDNPPQPQDLDFLLPAWADQGGWSNPQQYQTITTADVDGDGTNELVGRNAAFLEVFEWARPSEALGPDAPGEWVASAIPGPTLTEADWWFDPSVYSTFRAADVDGDGADELVYRSVTGVQVLDLAHGAWAKPTAGPPWGDDNPSASHLWEEQYYDTFRAGDVDGDGRDELLLRTQDGMDTWGLQTDGTWATQQSGGSRPFANSSSGGWDNPYYTTTIQLGDLTGDGHDDLLARGHDGLVLYTWQVSDPTTGAGTWSALATSGPWTDDDGWDHHRYFETITTGQLDGSTGVEVVGRGEYGLDAYRWSGSAWQEVVATPTSAAPSVLTDAQGFTQPPYYATIQTAALLATQPDQVIARWPDGLHTYRIDTSTTPGTFVETGTTWTQLSDTNGWDQNVRYPTIQAVTISPGQGQAVIARDATGLRTQQLSTATSPSTWVDPSAAFPVWTTHAGADSPAGRSYTWINQWLQEHNDITASDGTLIGAYQSLQFDPVSTADALRPSLDPKRPSEIPPPPFGNVPRDTWEDVKQSTSEWTQTVADVQSYLVVGNNGGSVGTVSSLLLDTFVSGGSTTSIDDIANNFTSSDPAVLALIGDLIWGLLGAIPGEAIFVAPAEVAVNAAALTFNGSMSIAGAGVSAGMGFANTDGSVNSEARKLDNEIQNAFCAANAYLTIAYGDVVAALGPLTAMRQMYDDGILQFVDEEYADIQASSNTAISVWAYQQMSSMHDHGWRTGYCDDGKDCNDGFDDVALLQPPGGGYYYKAIPTDGDATPNCIFSSGGHVSGWGQLTGSDPGDLGVDPATDIFQPYVPAARTPKAGSLGEPYDDLFSESGRMGILGWRISTHSCQL